MIPLSEYNFSSIIPSGRKISQWSLRNIIADVSALDRYPYWSLMSVLDDNQLFEIVATFPNDPSASNVTFVARNFTMATPDPLPSIKHVHCYSTGVCAAVSTGGVVFVQRRLEENTWNRLTDIEALNISATTVQVSPDRIIVDGVANGSIFGAWVFIYPIWDLPVLLFSSVALVDQAEGYTLKSHTIGLSLSLSVFTLPDGRSALCVFLFSALFCIPNSFLIAA